MSAPVQLQPGACKCPRKAVAAPTSVIAAVNCHARQRHIVVPQALASPSGGPAPQIPQNSQHGVWASKLIRATIVATTLQYAASQAAYASQGGGWGAGGSSGGSGGGGGGGGDGPSSASGHAGSTNVLGDLAEATDLVEEVILLDVGGALCHRKHIFRRKPEWRMTADASLLGAL